jgi:DNA repair exonuclease SbcCD ATPase subunit
LSTELAQFEASRASTQTRTELLQLEKELALAQGFVRVREAELGAAERRAASNAAAAAQAATNVKFYEDKVAQAQAEKTEAEAKLAREADYLDMIRGFYNKVFDEFFQEAGAEATRMLAGLPNADHLSLQFRSEYETGADTVKSRFTPVVLVDGVERTIREALSGGQTNSVQLAADLAVVRVITNRLGVNLSWLVLDETFTGYGPQTKQACLELLQQYAADKLVLVVDHTSETQELFNKRVEVVMESKRSRLVVCS